MSQSDLKTTGGAFWRRFDFYTVIMLFILAMVAERHEIFTLLEEQTLSARHILRTAWGSQHPERQLSSDVVLVTMDEAFFADYGSYPLKRSDIAHLVDNLYLLGASVIALDILFDFKSSYGEDPILAESLKRAGNVLLVSQAVLDAQGEGYMSYPTDLLRQAAQRTGYTNIQSMSAFVSSMSRLTIYPQMMEEADGWPFAMQALAMHRKVDLRWNGELRAVEIGSQLKIPLDRKKNLYIDYVPLPAGSQFISESRGLSALEFIRLNELGEDEIAELRHWIAGKIVLVGDTSQVSHDIFTTPVGQVYGMEIIANTIDTLMKGAPLQPLHERLELLVSGVFMGLLMWAMFIVQPVRRGFYGLGVVLLFVVIAVGLYVVQGVAVSMTYNLLALVGSMVAINLRFYLQERSQKALISGIFGHYLSPDVIKELVNNPAKLALGGERREMTAFFSDVAAFSSFSEKLTPEELVALLNEYLTAMCDIIIAHGGVIDKFEGDAIIAFWGAPLERPDHALQACLASVRMQQFMRHFSRQVEQQRGFPLAVRMGVNSGPMVVGNMGSRQRMDYTIMGDAVNLASRLEGANKFYRSHIMISEATKQLAGSGVVTRELDAIRVVGKKEPVVVHELLAVEGEVEPPLQHLLEGYQEGLQLYKARQFRAAADRFAELVEQFSDDGPSKTYLERCRHFMEQPPAADWDGVTTLSSKG